MRLRGSTVKKVLQLTSSLCLPLRYLWANGYKDKGISGRDHYIFCSTVIVGTACTA